MKAIEFELQVIGKSNVYIPTVLNSIEWTTEFSGKPGELKFSAYLTNNFNVSFGDIVNLSVNGKHVFKGYVFTTRYSTESKVVEVTAYDQIRYLQNDISMALEDMTIGQVMAEIAQDFDTKLGSVYDSGTVLTANGAPLIFNSVEALEAIETCIEIIRRVENRMLVLHDDAGVLNLSDISTRFSETLIEAPMVQEIATETTIDKHTYNRIRLIYGESSDETSENIYIKDGSSISDIGVLALTQKLNLEGEYTPEQAADELLKIFREPTRELNVTGVVGDPLVKAGMFVPISFELDTVVNAQNYCTKQVKHKIENGIHTMDLTLMGVDIL